MKHLTSVLLFTIFWVCNMIFALPFTPEEQIQAAESGRQQRQAEADHNEAVDFGAHTGDHGAFGWYADFPVHANADK